SLVHRADARRQHLLGAPALLVRSRKVRLRLRFAHAVLAPGDELEPAPVVRLRVIGAAGSRESAKTCRIGGDRHVGRWHALVRHADEALGCDTNDRTERLVHTQCSANDVAPPAVSRLPERVAQYDDWCSEWRAVFLGGEKAAECWARGKEIEVRRADDAYL